MWYLFLIIFIILLAILIDVRKYLFYFALLRSEKGGSGGDEDVARFWYLLDGSGYGQGVIYIPENDFDMNIDQILAKYNAHVELAEESTDPPLWGMKPVTRRDVLLEYSRQNSQKYSSSNDILEKYTHVKNIRELSDLTKNIVKKFVPDDDNPLNYTDRNSYHCKGDEINKRITSFNHLRNVVSSDPIRFSNIKFPNRYLVVKENNSATSLGRKDLLTYIDDNFRLIISASGEIEWSIKNPRYTIIVCSTRVKPNDHPFKLSSKAKEQLIDLVSSTPFDTSYNTGGNVFAVGDDAWIVDGKNKGGSSSEMIKQILAIK